VPLGIVAIVLAVMAKGKIARGEAGGAGLAKAGMICGVIGSVVSILFVILVLAGLTVFGDRMQKELEQQRMQEQQQTTTQP
jgi:hypothetical protein